MEVTGQLHSLNAFTLVTFVIGLHTEETEQASARYNRYIWNPGNVTTGTENYAELVFKLCVIYSRCWQLQYHLKVCNFYCLKTCCSLNLKAFHAM
jgi:hypothetical protein